MFFRVCIEIFAVSPKLLDSRLSLGVSKKFAMDSHTSYSFSVILVVLLAFASATTTLGATNFAFTFFLHDNLLTLNPSADAITLPVVISPIGSFFGTLVVFDDSMTVGPDPNSLEIARARGFYLFDANDNKGPAIYFSWTAQFNAASSSLGTTLTFAGFDRTTDATREISIIGGTGLFRYARGYASITTHSLVGAAAVLNITATFTYGL